MSEFFLLRPQCPEQGLQWEGAQKISAEEGNEDSPLRLCTESCKAWGRTAECGAVSSGRGENRVAPGEAARWVGP